MKKRAKRNKQKHARRNVMLYILLGSVAAVIIAVAALSLYQKIYYQDRWYQGTMINGVDVSGQTFEKTREDLIKDRENYSLLISGRGYGELLINGSDIDYIFDIGEGFGKAFQEQHKHLQLIPRNRNYELEYDVSYDQEKLEDLVKHSELLQGGTFFHIKKPENAHVEFSEEKQQFILVEEELGNKLKPAKLIDAVETALQQAQTEMDLNEDQYAELYQAPKIYSDNEELQEELEVYNQAALRYIEWDMGHGVVESITPTELSKWIKYKNGVLKYDQPAIEKWVEDFCLKYKTVGNTRMVKSHTGKQVEVIGGDYGWQLDFMETLSQAKKAIRKKLDNSLIEAYIADPSESNRQALTMQKKVKYLNTAYQMDYENFAVDWDTENYVEVSIQDQMVYVFRKGKVAFSCRCITGRPEEGRITPTGAYFIKEHREEYTLTGDDYETPVENWVRVTWTGTGFHPATWQPWSRWTKDLYKTIGSHGCINLSVEDAETIYEMTSYREAVFIY